MRMQEAESPRKPGARKPCLKVLEPKRRKLRFIKGIHSIDMTDGGCLIFTFYALRRKRGKIVREIIPEAMVIEGHDLPTAIKQASVAAATWAKRTALKVVGKIAGGVLH